MAAGATYTPIATTTLGSAQASYTFSSISGSYTDLVLICGSLGTSSSGTIMLTFNSDTGTNYSYTELDGYNVSGTMTTKSDRTSSATKINFTNWVGTDTNNNSNLIVNINNYSNSTTYKTAIGRMNNGTSVNYAGTAATVGLWRSTAAITSVTITPSSGNLITGSIFTLYGIVAA